MTYNTIDNDITIAGGAEGALLANRYRIVRQLGQGGMGSVWLAEDTQLDNKPFAIKMLPSILVSNKRAYRQLKDEALVAMKLVHPNIVQLRAFEENNGNPFLVMDYIEGQTLDDYLAENGKITEEETVRLLRPIASALDYAHGEGVVHRDVKPANVMIRKNGHPYIFDFGIAREIQETMTRVTGKLSSGTLLYMSPEQLNGDAPKPAQDIYSFAAMAYECMKGEPPFVRGAIEDQIKNKPPEPLHSDGAFVVGIMAGLAKKPEDRPKTCAAVLEGKVLSRVERVERVDGNASRRGSETQRKGGAGVVLAVLALAAVIGIGGLVYYQTQERQRTDPERQKTAKRLRTEAESNLVPTAKVVIKVNGAELKDGETVKIGSTEWKTPIVWGAKNITKGSRYGGEVAYEKNGRRYLGQLDDFTVNWSGLRTFGVSLKEYTGPKHGDVKTLTLPGGATMEMIYVGPGTFTMGSPSSEEGRKNDETPHRVTLTKGFWLGKYEVTQKQWRSVMGSNPSEFKGDSNPVEIVSWNDCQEFVRKVNDAARRQFGGGARLPTEAEWEYACRAGTSGAYAGTGRLDDMGWYWDNSGGKTHPVGQKRPNAWGFYDMHGNVYEWCSDRYGSYEGDTTNPIGAASGDDRVLRGGGWDAGARFCRSAPHVGYYPGYRYGNYGFRLCCSALP